MKNQKVIESKITYKFFEVKDSDIQKTGKSPLEYINEAISDIAKTNKELDIFSITYESTYNKTAKSWNVKYTISYDPKVREE